MREIVIEAMRDRPRKPFKKQHCTVCWEVRFVAPPCRSDQDVLLLKPRGGPAMSVSASILVVPLLALAGYSTTGSSSGTAQADPNCPAGQTMGGNGISG